MSDHHLGIMPADTEGKVDALSGIGSGPYKLADFQPGVVMNANRNDKYHRGDQAFFDAIRLVCITDANARQAALVAGEIDAVSDVDLKTVDMLGKSPDIRVDETPGGTYNGMPMNCKVSPFSNSDFRQAMKYLMNRQQIVDKIMLNHATIGNDQPVSPVMPYFAPDVPQRPYDPDKAKFHMTKSGLGNVKISLSAGEAAFTGSVEMGLLIREEAAKIGIDLEVVREPADGYWSNVWKKKPFVVVANGQRPTPDMIFTIFFKDGAPWNDTDWSDPKFQSLLVAAKSEVDQKKRAEMYREMQMICSDDGGTLIPFFRNKIYARRSNVAHGPHLSSTWEMDGAKAYQRWWFES
jgi:peptide/nickel transport system substrate-binding protein